MLDASTTLRVAVDAGAGGKDRSAMIRPDQCRAARAFLKWSQSDLADAAHLSLESIRDFETERRELGKATVLAIQAALEHAGIAFTNGDEPGVKLTGKRAE